MTDAKPPGASALRRVQHALGLDRAGAPAPAAPGASDSPATMRKGAVVVVRLAVEGDDAPAHDFTATATAAARAVAEAGIAARPTPLAVTIKDVAVDDDPPDADR